MQPTRLLIFSRKLCEKTITVHQIKFCDRLSQNLMEIKNGYKLQPNYPSPWGHHRLILDKITDPAALLYYLRATAQFGWSRNVLLNQIKAGGSR